MSSVSFPSRYEEILTSHLRENSLRELGLAASISQCRALINLEIFARDLSPSLYEPYGEAIHLLRQFFVETRPLDTAILADLTERVIHLDDYDHALASFAQESQSAVCDLFEGVLNGDPTRIAATFGYSLNTASSLAVLEDFSEWQQQTGGAYAPEQAEHIEQALQANDLTLARRWPSAIADRNSRLWTPPTSNAGVPRR